MDYQRKIFYSRRREILSGRGLKDIIAVMIEGAIAKSCDTILDEKYALRCIEEWARSNFSVDLKLSEIEGLSAGEIEGLIKDKTKDNVANEISMSLGEYLEDYEDRDSWDIGGLCKWAMSAFRVSLSVGKVRHLSPDEIEEQLIAAAAEQVEKKDCSQVVEFLKDDFAIRTFAQWARVKFDIKLDAAKLRELKTDEIRELINAETAKKYKAKEIEYPVEFAMNMVYGPEGANVYGFESLAKWANDKYNASFSIESLQNSSPGNLQKKLLELSETFNNGQLEREIDGKIDSLGTEELLGWAEERFRAALGEQDIGEGQEHREKLLEAGREFLRSELSDLERYVLLQVYDGTWKDHLYAMDHLKSSIWTRSFAEKDPKVEYKREGFRMFNEMLAAIEDKVTDIIFKVHLEAGARARSVWSVSQTAHDEVGQFAMAERQRAAAQAPQGEQKVKQIKLETPKVGRNDPCPCGSGKKYKKCCGKNA